VPGQDLGRHVGVAGFHHLGHVLQSHSNEPVERLRDVVEETEARCPVFNLISDAGVNLEANWVRRGPEPPS
jgi:uncharacterized OsmC-like protein